LLRYVYAWLPKTALCVYVHVTVTIHFAGQKNRCPCFCHIGTLGPKTDLDASCIKIADAKSCQLVTIGTISNMLCLCTTNKKKVAVFEINPKKLQYGRIKVSIVT